MKKIHKATKNKKIRFAGGNTRYNEQTFTIGIGRTQLSIGDYRYRDYFIIGINLFWIWFNLNIMLPSFLQRGDCDD